MVDDDSANPHLSLWRRKFDTRGEKPNRELAEEVREEGQEPLRSAEEIERVFAPDAECGVRDAFFKTEADHLQVPPPPHTPHHATVAQTRLMASRRCVSPSPRTRGTGSRWRSFGSRYAAAVRRTCLSTPMTWTTVDLPKVL